MKLMELRCDCHPKGREQSPLLAMASGTDFHVEIRCRFCKRLKSFRYPHPLGVAVERNKRLERKEK